MVTQHHAVGVQLKRLGFAYPGADEPTLTDIDLEISAKEFVVLVGESGCGKSTLLRLLAGLERPTQGEIFFDERDVSRLEPKARDVAMVFQSYALYPHMTVGENLGFRSKSAVSPKRTGQLSVQEIGSMLGLADLLERLPAELSGGQRQRAAIGRAMVRQPSIFLFDEPLSNLDANLRSQMRAELAARHQELGVTTVYVTHDQVEAMTLADRIVLSAAVASNSSTPPRVASSGRARLTSRASLGNRQRLCSRRPCTAIMSASARRRFRSTCRWCATRVT